MTEERSKTELKIQVTSVQNLVSTREEVSWFRIEVEFMGKTLTSEKIDLPKKGLKKSLNFSGAFDFATETVENIEAVVNHSILFKLIEVTREKKKKNDTLILQGIISIDPLLLLNGSPTIEDTLEVDPQEALLEFQKKRKEETTEGTSSRKDSLEPIATPSITFSVSTQDNLLPSTWNILTCDLKGIVRVPDSIQPSPFNFELGDESIPLHIAYTDGTFLQTDTPYSFEVDHGDTSRVLNGSSPCVMFKDFRKRLCLSETRQADLVGTISRLRTTRVLLSKAQVTGGKTPKRIDGENQTEAKIKLTPLLYPGNTHMSCAGLLKAVEEEKEEGSSPAPPIEEKEKKNAKGKKGGAMVPAPVESSSIEGQVFEDAGTAYVLNINVLHPLVLKRTHEEVVARVTELIPPRRVQPASILAAKKAVDNFRDTITGIASDLIHEYRQTQAKEHSESVDDTKDMVIQNLGSNGRYEAFKEKIKASVILLVREKFTDVNRFTDTQSRHEFVSKLYVYLTQQMHEMLNKQFSFSQSPEYEEVSISLNLLMDFALENEGLLHFDRAADMWSECVIRFAEDVDAWYGYACFSSRMGDFSKCEECLHRAIQLNREHTPSLALLGTVLVLQGSSMEGLDLLEAATSYEKESEILWLHRMFLLKYVDPNDSVVEMCNLHAEKQRQCRDSVYDTSCLFIADHFLNLGLTALAQSAVATEILEHGTSIGVNVILARIAASEADNMMSSSQNGQNDISDEELTTRHSDLHEKDDKIMEEEEEEEDEEEGEEEGKEGAIETKMQRDVNQEDDPDATSDSQAEEASGLERALEDAVKRIDESLSVQYSEPELWVQLGNIMYENGHYDRAREAFEHAIDLPTIKNEHIVALRLGDIYVMEEEFELAKTLFLRRCTSTTTSRGWFGLGVACYRLGELGESEEAFAEANMYDSKNPQIWGYLCLICLRSGRGVEAEQCFKFAAKLNLQDDELLNEIRLEMAEAGVQSSILS
eukprot:m.18287 g.18287  ORF g.18287 m.18287 type:complete len:989 (-) comp4944_c0_seq1:155-3121(-)